MEADDIVFVETVPFMTLISSSREHPNETTDELSEGQDKMSDNPDHAPGFTPREAKVQLDHIKGGEMHRTLHTETETREYPMGNGAGGWRPWQHERSMDYRIDADVSKTPLGPHGVEEREPMGGRQLSPVSGLPFSHSGLENRPPSPPPQTRHHLPLAMKEISHVPQQPMPPPVRNSELFRNP
jgi:hypothetical protein